MTRKCRRRLFRRSPHINARFLANVQLRLEKCGLEVGFAVLNYCTSPLPPYPFPTHLTQQHSTQNQPTQHNSKCSTTSSQQVTPQQHPHRRRLCTWEPRSRFTLPPPHSPLRRLLRVSTTDHKQPPPRPTVPHILNVPLGKLHQHHPLPLSKHTTRHIQLTCPPGTQRTRYRLPYTPIPTGVRLAAQGSLGVV